MSLLADLEIPRSTLATWMTRGQVDVVTLEGFDETHLQVELLKLRRRVRVLGTVVGVLKAVIWASGFEMDGRRLPTVRTEGSPARRDRPGAQGAAVGVGVAGSGPVGLAVPHMEAVSQGVRVG